MEEYTQEIESYYTESLRDYEIVWQLKSSMALHYGYWDENVNTHKQALWNMNYQVAKNAQIKKSDFVLDAGCGVGGTSFFLANNIGCKVEGVTLSEGHLKRSLEYKENNDPNNLVSFSSQNYCNTNFADNSFDVIFCLESLCNSDDKLAFLKEAYRLLKPNGRLLISDFFVEKTDDKNQIKTLDKWAKSWVVPHFINSEDISKEIKNVGFKNFFLKDLSKYVYPSIKLMHRSYYPGVFISKISNLFGYRTDKQLENSKSGRYQYLAYQSKNWKYTHLLVFKNTDDNCSSFEDFAKEEYSFKYNIDEESFKKKFPILSKKGFSVRNIFKRIMHFYLETGIKNPDKKF
jgi:tocopherol O-methyltransferase